MTASIKSLEKRVEQALADHAKIEAKVAGAADRLAAAEAARQPLLLSAALDDPAATKALLSATQERDETANLLGDLQAALVDASGLVGAAQTALREGKHTSVRARLQALGTARAGRWESIAQLRAQILTEFAEIRGAGVEIASLAQGLPEIAPRGMSRREISDHPHGDFQALVAVLNDSLPRDLAAGWHELAHFLSSMRATGAAADAERKFWGRAIPDTDAA